MNDRKVTPKVPGPPVASSGGWTNENTKPSINDAKRPEPVNSTSGQLVGALGGFFLSPYGQDPYGQPLNWSWRTAFSAAVTLNPEGLSKGNTDDRLPQPNGNTSSSGVVQGMVTWSKGFSCPLLFSLQQRYVSNLNITIFTTADGTSKKKEYGTATLDTSSFVGLDNSIMSFVLPVFKTHSNKDKEVCGWIVLGLQFSGSASESDLETKMTAVWDSLRGNLDQGRIPMLLNDPYPDQQTQNIMESITLHVAFGALSFSDNTLEPDDILYAVVYCGTEDDVMLVLDGEVATGSKSSDDDTLREGSKVTGNFKGRGKYYPGKISRVRINGTYDIAYDDGEVETGVTVDMIKAVVSSTVSDQERAKQIKALKWPWSGALAGTTVSNGSRVVVWEKSDVTVECRVHKSLTPVVTVALYRGKRCTSPTSSFYQLIDPATAKRLGETTVVLSRVSLALGAPINVSMPVRARDGFRVAMMQIAVQKTTLASTNIISSTVAEQSTALTTINTQNNNNNIDSSLSTTVLLPLAVVIEEGSVTDPSWRQPIEPFFELTLLTPRDNMEMTVGAVWRTRTGFIKGGGCGGGGSNVTPRTGASKGSTNQDNPPAAVVGGSSSASLLPSPSLSSTTNGWGLQCLLTGNQPHHITAHYDLPFHLTVHIKDDTNNSIQISSKFPNTTNTTAPPNPPTTMAPPSSPPSYSLFHDSSSRRVSYRSL